MKAEWNFLWQRFLCGLQKKVYTELDLQFPVPSSLPAPSCGSLCPTEQGMGFCQLSRDLAGAATCCRRPQDTPGLLGLTQLVRPLIAMEIGWAATTSCLLLPAHTPGVGLGTHHLFQTNLLAVVLGFCAQGRIEPEIQGISKLNLHPITGSGSCCNSEVKETVCCHKIKQCFNVLSLKIFKCNV